MENRKQIFLLKKKPKTKKTKNNDKERKPVAQKQDKS